jgi:uncharacterized membrane protein
MPQLAALAPEESRTVRDRIAGAFAYFTFVPAVFFLMRERHRKNRYIRFHAVQCLLFWGVGIVVALALRVATYLFYFLPAAGPLFVVLMWVVAALAAFFVWLVLTIKALRGEMFKLPFLGETAAAYAGEPTSDSRP